MLEVLQLARDIEGDRLATFDPYAWQAEWLNASADNQELMIRGANRVGKTTTPAVAVAWHLTGLYPDSYRGKRFDRPTTIWCAGVSAEAARDVIQTQLIGGLGERFGTGWIPRRCLVGTPTMRQAGIRNCVDAFQVRHVSGGISTCTIKSYEQRAEKFQGAPVDTVWLDEEPHENEIFTESLTRVLTTGGLVFVTFTPLLGPSLLVEHFQMGGPGIFMKCASWDDAPHLDEAQKARMWESYPAHERDARTKGIPKLGEGSVFGHLIDQCIIEPVPLDPHWRRIKGWDFGIGHASGGVAVARDLHTDTIYVYSDYRRKGASIAEHCEWLNSFDRWCPVAYPHDGENRQPHSGKTLAQIYREYGANFLGKSARYPSAPGEKERGGSQPTEPVLADLLERAGSNRLKIFSNCTSLIEEMRDLHRRNGKVAPIRDDVYKALTYAVMMIRYAAARAGGQRRFPPQPPIASSRI